ncbi:hypothetical protein GCM10022245_41640 [Streptomyces mayteni]
MAGAGVYRINPPRAAGCCCDDRWLVMDDFLAEAVGEVLDETEDALEDVGVDVEIDGD